MKVETITTGAINTHVKVPIQANRHKVVGREDTFVVVEAKQESPFCLSCQTEFDGEILQQELDTVDKLIKSGRKNFRANQTQPPALVIGDPNDEFIPMAVPCLRTGDMEFDKQVGRSLLLLLGLLVMGLSGGSLVWLIYSALVLSVGSV